MTAKSSPWRAALLRDVETKIGFLKVTTIRTGESRDVPGAPSVITQKAGTFTFKTKAAAQAFVDAQRRDHGQDVCSNVYRESI